MQNGCIRHYYSMIPAALLATACILVTAGCRKQSPADADSAFQQPSDSAQGNVPDQPSMPILNIAPPTTVVEVNGSKLMQNELDNRLQSILAAQGLDGLPPQQRQAVSGKMRNLIIEAFIAETLICEDAARQKIEATDDDVNAEIDNIRSSLPEGLALEDLLQQRGLTMEFLRRDIGRELTINKVLEARTASLPKPTEEEIEAFYKGQPDAFEMPEKVRARHVLIDAREGLPEEEMLAKKVLAEKCQKELADGADFAAVAREHSARNSREKGGDLGFIARGETVPEFEEAAFSQPPNKVGPVVQTQFGYHIIEVLDHQEARTKPLEEAREEIIARLNDQQRKENLDEYVNGLKSSADIKMGPGQQPLPQ